METQLFSSSVAFPKIFLYICTRNRKYLGYQFAFPTSARGACRQAFFFVCLWVLGLFACGDKNVAEADRLNSMAYAFHYRNLDSTAAYAQRALNVSGNYAAGRAEALNNMAFVRISKMEFETASELLNDVKNVTDNQVELLVADVQLTETLPKAVAQQRFL